MAGEGTIGSWADGNVLFAGSLTNNFQRLQATGGWKEYRYNTTVDGNGRNIALKGSGQSINALSSISIDNGSTWAAATDFTSAPPQTYHFVHDVYNSGTMFAFQENADVGGGSKLYFNSGGTAAGWFQMQSGIPVIPVGACMAGSRLWVISAGGAPGTGSFIYRSEDAGSSFLNVVKSGATSTLATSGLAIAFMSSTLGGYYDGTGSLSYSSDAGSTWAAVSNVTLGTTPNSAIGTWLMKMVNGSTWVLSKSNHDSIQAGVATNINAVYMLISGTNGRQVLNPGPGALSEPFVAADNSIYIFQNKLIYFNSSGISACNIVAYKSTDMGSSWMIAPSMPSYDVASNYDRGRAKEAYVQINDKDFLINAGYGFIRFNDSKGWAT